METLHVDATILYNQAVELCRAWAGETKLRARHVIESRQSLSLLGTLLSYRPGNFRRTCKSCASPQEAKWLLHPPRIPPIKLYTCSG
jgi:hypothetical protein